MRSMIDGDSVRDCRRFCAFADNHRVLGRRRSDDGDSCFLGDGTWCRAAVGGLGPTLASLCAGLDDRLVCLAIEKVQVACVGLSRSAGRLAVPDVDLGWAEDGELIGDCERVLAEAEERGGSASFAARVAMVAG